MAMNPYAKYLGEQDARVVLAATPGLVHQAICTLSPEESEAPIAPGKWSVRVMVAHLADCELAFGFRLRQTLAVDGGVAQAFDQDAWAKHYAGYDLPAGMEVFRALRGWNLKLVGQLSDADLAKTTTHPERGTTTFSEILEMMAGHDLNHVGQLQLYAGRLAVERNDLG